MSSQLNHDHFQLHVRGNTGTEVIVDLIHIPSGTTTRINMGAGDPLTVSNAIATLKEARSINAQLPTHDPSAIAEMVTHLNLSVYRAFQRLRTIRLLTDALSFLEEETANVPSYTH